MSAALLPLSRIEHIADCYFSSPAQSKRCVQAIQDALREASAPPAGSVCVPRELMERVLAELADSKTIGPGITGGGFVHVNLRPLKDEVRSLIGDK